MDLSFGNQRKVYMWVKEGATGKGIETFIDDVAIKNLTPMYKAQIANILMAALEELGYVKQNENINARA
jgi:hypothetical protein